MQFAYSTKTRSRQNEKLRNQTVSTYRDHELDKNLQKTNKLHASFETFHKIFPRTILAVNILTLFVKLQNLRY